MPYNLSCLISVHNNDQFSDFLVLSSVQFWKPKYTIEFFWKHLRKKYFEYWFLIVYIIGSLRWSCEHISVLFVKRAMMTFLAFLTELFRIFCNHFILPSIKYSLLCHFLTFSFKLIVMARIMMVHHVSFAFELITFLIPRQNNCISLNALLIESIPFWQQLSCLQKNMSYFIQTIIFSDWLVSF